MTQENKPDAVEEEQDRLWENKSLTSTEKIIAEMIKGDNSKYRGYVTYWNRRTYRLNVLFLREFAGKIIEKIKEEIDGKITLLKEAEKYAPNKIKENVRIASNNCIFVLEELKQSFAKFGMPEKENDEPSDPKQVGHSSENIAEQKHKKGQWCDKCHHTEEIE